MALSNTAIRQAKASGKAYTLGDTDGLSLAVSPEGGKSWHFRYSWKGKQKRLSLGTYPEVTLRQARTRRDQARELVARGINPRKQRTQDRLEALRSEAYTFQKVFDQWFEFRKLSLKPGRQSTQEQIQRIFNKDLLPALGPLSVYEIRRSDLLDVLEDIERRSAFTTAEKCRTWLHQMFRYALVKVPGLEQSPASDLDVVAAPKPPVQHNPFLRMGELPELLQKLRGYKGKLQTQLGLKLLLLTGVRTGSCAWLRPTSSAWMKAYGSSRQKWSSSCNRRCARTASFLAMFRLTSFRYRSRRKISSAICWMSVDRPRSTSWRTGASCSSASARTRSIWPCSGWAMPGC